MENLRPSINEKCPKILAELIQQAWQGDVTKVKKKKNVLSQKKIFFSDPHSKK